MTQPALKLVIYLTELREIDLIGILDLQHMSYASYEMFEESFKY